MEFGTRDSRRELDRNGLAICEVLFVQRNPQRFVIRRLEDNARVAFTQVVA